MKAIISVEIAAGDNVDDSEIDQLKEDFKDQVRDDIFSTDPGDMHETLSGMEYEVTSVSVKFEEDE